jgi:hypothetical protein
VEAAVMKTATAVAEVVAALEVVAAEVEEIIAYVTMTALAAEAAAL